MCGKPCRLSGAWLKVFSLLNLWKFPAFRRICLDLSYLSGIVLILVHFMLALCYLIFFNNNVNEVTPVV